MLDMFFHKRELIKAKSTVIIRRLSMSLDPEKLFVTFAESLLKFEDPIFISTMVQTLDFLLLTESDLGQLRRKLKSFKFDKENEEDNTKLFTSLFNTWVYNPVATLTLCFLTHQYELAFNIIQSL